VVLVMCGIVVTAPPPGAAETVAAPPAKAIRLHSRCRCY